MAFGKKFDISTKLRAALIADERVKSFVGERIFPCVAPEGTNDDFIIYYRDEYSIVPNSMGNPQSCKVMVIIISNDYDDSQKIAEAVFDCVSSGFGKNYVELSDSTEDYIDKKFFQFLLFNIT